MASKVIPRKKIPSNNGLPPADNIVKITGKQLRFVLNAVKPHISPLLAFKEMIARNQETISLPMEQAEARKLYLVAGIDDQHSDANRLKALGFCEGREVEVLRKGHAWVVRVLGSRVGLSNQLAGAIQLVPAA